MRSLTRRTNNGVSDTRSSARQDRILLNHLPVPVDGEAFLSGLQDDSAEETARPPAGFLGPLQRFFKGLAVVRCHVRKGRRRYGQNGAHPGDLLPVK